MQPDTAEIQRQLDLLFRRQAGQLVATLTRVFGAHRLDLAEAVVQDALLQAMQTWTYQGIPDNPAGWIVRVARNKALDAIRHDKMRASKEAALTQAFGEEVEPATEAVRLSGEEQSHLSDDQLRLLMVCCHPALTRDAQVSLALKTLFGFGVREIARAFLGEEAAIAQRLVRAKAKLQDVGARFELPSPAELPERLAAAMEVLYLVFNEGYGAHQGDELVRHDMCQEALRVAALLAEHPVLARPKVHALCAIMCFHAARFATRTDDAGDLLLLEDQDRSKWDQELIARGISHLNQAAAGDELSDYHLQAGIASCHALAPSFADTRWDLIVAHYDDLMAVAPSPVIALNRAAALAMADGPEIGLRALRKLKKEPKLAGYYLLHGVEGELLRRLGRGEAACKAFQEALTCAMSEPERRFIQARIAGL